jgi:hypothetical protein
VTEEIVYECLDPHTVLFTHIITSCSPTLLLLPSPTRTIFTNSL